MKKAKKKRTNTTAITKRSSKVAKKVKAFLGRKKTGAIIESLFMNNHLDPAHSPGHRKLNLIDPAQKKRKFFGHLQKVEAVNRTTTNRRIITGAALGKTGQLVIK